MFAFIHIQQTVTCVCSGHSFTSRLHVSIFCFAAPLAAVTAPRCRRSLGRLVFMQILLQDQTRLSKQSFNVFLFLSD